MSSKFNKFLFLLLILQTAVILFLDRPWSSGHLRDPAGEKGPAFFPAFEPGEATRIEIGRPGERIVLERRAGESLWDATAEAERFLADTFRVDSLLSALSRMEKTDRVSSNPDKAEVFGLDESSALELTVQGRGGAELLALRIGKSLGALRGSYVNLPGENEVYRVPEDLRRICDPGGDWTTAWREQSLLSCDPARIEAIAVERPEGRLLLEKRAAEGEGAESVSPWRMIEPSSGVLAPGEGERLAETLCSLKARALMDPAYSRADLGLEVPDVTIRVQVREKEGSRIITLFWSPDRQGRRYLFLESQSEKLFEVAGYLLQPFLAPPESLLAKEGAE